MLLGILTCTGRLTTELSAPNCHSAEAEQPGAGGWLLGAYSSHHLAWKLRDEKPQGCVPRDQNGSIVLDPTCVVLLPLAEAP